jgi:hypothetical protein
MVECLLCLRSSGVGSGMVSDPDKGDVIGAMLCVLGSIVIDFWPRGSQR